MSYPRRTATAAAVSAALLAAACGGGQDATEAVTPVASSPGSPATTSPVSATPATSATPVATAAPSEPAEPTAVTLAPLVSGLATPIGIEHAADGSDRLFVIEQGGVVRVIGPDRALVDEPFLDLTDRVRVSYEEGLLGLAFHPGFEENRRVFAHYTSSDGRSVVAEYTANEDGTAADPASERVVVEAPNRANNHNGGRIAFGPDGFLYIAWGEDANPPNAQDTMTLLGKLLRIDVDAGAPYAIPPGNPFAAGGGAPEVWAYGLRNPWRFSFDRATGDLWIADVGGRLREEVNRQPAASTGGENYGWPVVEGTICAGGGECDLTAYVGPVADYGRESGDCVVIGGGVYRGAAEPSLVGRYVLADLCTGRLWTIDSDAEPGQRALVERDTVITGVSAFGEDEAGELYATDISGGRLLRVDATP